MDCVLTWLCPGWASSPSTFPSWPNGGLLCGAFVCSWLVRSYFLVVCYMTGVSDFGRFVLCPSSCWFCVNQWCTHRKDGHSPNPLEGDKTTVLSLRVLSSPHTLGSWIEQSQQTRSNCLHQIASLPLSDSPFAGVLKHAWFLMLCWSGFELRSQQDSHTLGIRLGDTFLMVRETWSKRALAQSLGTG